MIICVLFSRGTNAKQPSRTNRGGMEAYSRAIAMQGTDPITPYFFL